MMNNQNLLSHSPVEEIQVLKKKIDLEAQKSNAHDEKIKELNVKIQAAKQRNQAKRQKLVQIQQKVVQQQQKGNHLKMNPSSEDSSQNHLSSSLPSSLLDSNSSVSIVNQLKEHFKALRHQMMSEAWGQDQDDDQYYDEVDVDNMTYEELLELGQKIGKVSKGLDMKKMESLEVKKYKNPNPNEPFDCAICRDELEEGADCIQLHCHHVFHDQCIKGWLNVEKHCPNCKREIKIGGEQNLKSQN